MDRDRFHQSGGAPGTSGALQTAVLERCAWIGGFALGWLAVAAAGCVGGPRLIVDARSDLRAGVEFDGYEVQVLSEAGFERAEGAATVDDDAFEGMRVGEFGSVPAGPVEVVVRLLQGERVVLSRTLQATVDGDRAVVVPLYRACVDVTCPPSDDPSLTTCERGVCVSPECSAEHPEACPEAECATDADCASMGSGCLAGRCFAGECTTVADDALCGGGESCHPALGCVQSLNCTENCLAPLISSAERVQTGDATGDREGAAIATGEVFTLVTRPNGGGGDASIYRSGNYRRFLDGTGLTGSECGGSAAVGDTFMLMGCPGASGIVIQGFLGTSLVGGINLVAPFSGTRMGEVVAAKGDDYALAGPASGRIELMRGDGGSLLRAGSLSGPPGYGSAIAYDDGRLIVGSPNEGAVYFARTGDRLNPSESFGSLAGGEFGAALASNDSLLAVGAPGGATARVELFAYDGADYVPFETIEAPGETSGGRFGASLAMHGDLLAVGAPEYPSAAGVTGAVFIYRCDSQCVALYSIILADSTDGDEVGASVALQGSDLWFGAPGEGLGGALHRLVVP